MRDSSLPPDGMSASQRNHAVTEVSRIEDRLFCITLALEDEAHGKHLEHLRLASEHLQLWLSKTRLIGVQQQEQLARTATTNAAGQANTEDKPCV
jgi:hypothetical protein